MKLLKPRMLIVDVNFCLSFVELESHSRTKRMDPLSLFEHQLESHCWRLHTVMISIWKELVKDPWRALLVML